MAYGHTLLCDCEGKVISTPTPEDESESIVFSTLDPTHLAAIRNGVPTLSVSLGLLARQADSRPNDETCTSLLVSRCNICAPVLCMLLCQHHIPHGPSNADQSLPTFLVLAPNPSQSLHTVVFGEYPTFDPIVDHHLN